MKAWSTGNEKDKRYPEYAHIPGIVAIGGDLSVDRLLFAYANGIFPWYDEDEPILWWSLSPRMVLFPEELVVSKSMRPYFNQVKFTVTFNHNFAQVMHACKSVSRNRQAGGSWITEEIVTAYTQLNKLGYAHSVEVWQNDELVGGLYGVGLGRIFFGESMFARVPNASKFGFITWVRLLDALGIWLIDCQQETAHLGSMGAKPISISLFNAFLEKNTQEPHILKSWSETQPAFNL